MPVSVRRRLRLAAAESGETMGSLAVEAVTRLLDERESRSR